ncbi:TOMM precursor leader peptide-binding protein [Paraherbaspirillum soli]|uniref:TOMM leader peptide-binding protein n=1 Tax=Paraherbaspirillum soli TaxID=631222 RepID=A0ABW0MEZ1_9BURK
MNERLYISPLAEITTIGDDKIVLSVVGRRFTVEDRVGMLKSILANAEQGVTLAALTDRLSENFPAEAVEAAVKALVDTKVLVKRDGRASGDATHQHLEHRRELDGLIAAEQKASYDPANWVLALAGSGACADAIAASMAQLAVQVERLGEDQPVPDYGDKRALLLVCSDFENFGFFRKLNGKAVERGIPSLYLGIDWGTVQCGPLVIPKATACYECYYHRVRTTRKFVAEFDARSKQENILYHALPSKLAIQFGVAETSRLILQFLSGTLDNLHQSVFSEIDSLAGEINRSRILRLPRCPACGTANTARPVGSVFQQALLRRRA